MPGVFADRSVVADVGVEAPARAGASAGARTDARRAGDRTFPVTAGTTWVLDVDGVVWLMGEPIPGSSEAVRALRDQGVRVLFASNNSALTDEDFVSRLAAAGVPAVPEDLVTSSQAAAGMLAPGSSALAVAERGVKAALEARGVLLFPGGPVDAVVVGWTRHFDFDLLAAASDAVRQGARLIGTNEDATYPTPKGLLPGGGSILAAVATASGCKPDIAGKPHQPMVDLVVKKGGRPVVVVGDRPSTDGLLADRLGLPFALVLTGVTKAGDPGSSTAAAAVAADLAELVNRTLGRQDPRADESDGKGKIANC